MRENRERLGLEPDALRSRLDCTAHDDAAATIGGSDLANEIVGWLQGRLAGERGVLDC